MEPMYSPYSEGGELQTHLCEMDWDHEADLELAVADEQLGLAVEFLPKLRRFGSYLGIKELRNE